MSDINKVLFVYGTLQMGGVETLIVRAAEEFSRAGVKVTVLLMSERADPQLMKRLMGVARVVFLSEVSALGLAGMIGVFCGVDSRKTCSQFEEADAIFFFDSVSFLLGIRIAKSLSRPVALVGGCYHKNEYIYSGFSKKRYFVEVISKFLRKYIRERNIVFCNERVRDEFSKEYGDEYLSSVVVPVGVYLPEVFQREIGKVDRSLVVSIGRLVDFKTYNVEFIRAVASLKNKGIKVNYRIYGDGPLRGEMERLICDLDVGDRVSVVPFLEYSDMAAVLKGAGMFVGSGTALLEAAANGVPALIGIESNNQPTTYGFLSDTSGFSYQEIGLDFDVRPFDWFVERTLGLDEKDYADLCEINYSRAREFSISHMSDLWKGALMSSQRLKIEYPEAVFFRALISVVFSKLADSGLKRSFWNRYD